MARISSELPNCRQPVRKTPCCPDCGALECLCRPRFFAGQLLSEQDMNRLDQYIKNKGRLHNRHLHGWGVVNGLAVVCDPCGDVKVTQGYAVDPCGDDVVVCEETAVNICELIRKCKQAEPQPECRPFRHPPNTRCDEVEEEWVLTIQYREWASRGVTALRGNSCGAEACTSCGSKGGCNCGGGCECGARHAGAASSCSCGTEKNSVFALKKRAAPPQCEPTVTCEGYSFGVYKKPPENRDQDDDRGTFLQGAFWEEVLCCAQPLLDAIPPMPDLNNDSSLTEQAVAITQWCCRFRDNLLKYFHTHRNTNCEIIDHLHAIRCPNVNSPGTFLVDFVIAFLELLVAWAEGLKNCFCLALLPPTPQATCDVRIPLATVRIRARDCKVLSICNWTRERKIMLTWPAVTYWLSILPIGDFIRELLDRFCCNSLLDLFDDVLRRFPDSDDPPAIATADTVNESGTPKDFAEALHLASGAVAAKFSADLSGRAGEISRLAESLFARGGEPLEIGAVLNKVSPRFKLPDNGKALSQVEAKHLPLVLLTEVTVKPVLSSVLGSGGAEKKVDEFMRNLARGRRGATNRGAPEADLEKRMTALHERLQEQEKQIQDLQRRLHD